MDIKISINLGNLLLSLSEVTDLANPAIAQHQLRTAFITLEMAKAADIDRDALKDLFTAALLHDVGAISVRILFDFVARGVLDKRIPDLVLDNYKQIKSYVSAEQIKGKEFHESFSVQQA